MPQLPASLQKRLASAQTEVASVLGLTPPMALEVQREVMWWLYARVLAARARTAMLLQGVAIGWTSTGYAELLPVEVPRAGRGMVSVVVDYSTVSPGTERARYLRLPNASFGLGMPGYSAAGRVIEIGAGVHELAVGDLVAVDGASHSSIATVAVRNAYRLPESVSLPAAAMIKLGIIAGNGVRRAEVGSGDRVCVIGAGLIGALAQRMAVAEGATIPAVVAQSRAKERIAMAGGAQRFLRAAEDADEIGQLSADVVIEATGNPHAMSLAIAAAAPRGRVVLLGSPRGATPDFPLQALQDKRLSVVGAHVENLSVESERANIDAARREGNSFLQAIADQRLSVDDLVGIPVDPRDAATFYRRLVDGSDIVSAHFDWTVLSEHERVRPGRVARVPSVRARGIDYARRPMKPPAEYADLIADLHLDDPFRGAQGMMRIGLLGCGDVAVSHAAAAALAPNTQLSVCYDPVERLARDVAARYGAKVAATAEALIDHPEVDAVLLAVPHHLHAPLAIQATESQKHVIVEKPLANTLSAAISIAAAAESAGVALSVCFPFRYMPAVIVARRLIELGALGRVTGAQVRLLMDKTPNYWVGGYSGRSPSDWRSSRAKAGGGILIMNMTHHVDLLRHLTGLDIDEVRAHGDPTDPDAPVEDAMVVSAQFANGAIGSITSCSSVRATDVDELRLWGQDGHLCMTPDPRVYTLRAIQGLHAARWQRFGHKAGGPSPRAIYLSRLATSLAEGLEPEVSAADGLAVQAFVEASYRANTEGCAIRPRTLIEGS